MVKKKATMKYDTNFYDVMDKLLRAVHAQWPEDRTRPGLVVAYLQRDGMYYVSIVRYRPTGPHYAEHEKYVVIGHKRPTLVEALNAVAADFVGMQSAKEDLRAALERAVRK